MTQLTERMTAAIENLKAQLDGPAPTPEQIAAQIHGIIDPQVADLKGKIEAIMAGEAADDEKVADIDAALNQFTAAFAPASPEGPMPDATPEPAPLPNPEVNPSDDAASS